MTYMTILFSLLDTGIVKNTNRYDSGNLIGYKKN